MTYNLDFKPKALKEWKKINSSIRLHFKKRLEKIIHNPRIPKNKLSGYNDIYKLKLNSSGFRLVYEVKDEQIVVLVLSVGKREDMSVYDNLKERV